MSDDEQRDRPAARQRPAGGPGSGRSRRPGGPRARHDGSRRVDGAHGPGHGQGRGARDSGSGRTGNGRGGNRGRPSPRRVAYEVVRAVQRDDAYANLLLPTRLDEAGLLGPDAGFATELTYGTLRMLGYYDAVIEIAAGRSPDDIDAEVLDVLRLGCHQHLGMHMRAHAAVNETVELAREVVPRGAVGFVNAVMRTITRTAPDAWPESVAEGREGDDRLGALTSHPAWIVRALRESLAAEGRGDELESTLAANNVPPTVSLVALPGFASTDAAVGRADAGGVADAGAAGAHSGMLEQGRVSPVAMTLRHGNPAAVAGVAEGYVRVQDEGSQLVALALVAARPVAPGERWLDLCAGPGGKTALLAAAGAPNATLDANEVSHSRARLVRRAVAPLELGIDVSENDGREIGRERPGRYDRVLVDAPCTGLGALRRRPEARWRKQPGDVGDLTRLQQELLESAIDATAPGGIVAYVTCSPHVAETTGIVGAVLRRRPEIELLDTAAIVERAAGPTAAGPTATSPEAAAPAGAGASAEATVTGSDGESTLDLAARPLAGGTTVQLWPHRHGTDAMFLALLRVP